MQYEVDYDEWSGVDASPVEISEQIAARYQDAADRGGRIVASHTLSVGRRETIFFVGAFPDERGSGASD